MEGKAPAIEKNTSKKKIQKGNIFFLLRLENTRKKQPIRNPIAKKLLWRTLVKIQSIQ